RRLFEQEQHISNIVFMGMGEPLHNYDNLIPAIRLLLDGNGLNFSNRKVTVSTVGLVPAIERFGQEDFQVGLAVSLNATTDEVRDRIMPINRRYNIETLLACLKAFPLEKRRRVTIEYVLLSGVNDTEQDARRLTKLLKGLPSKVNLIPWNSHEGSDFERPTRDSVDRFQRIVQDANYSCFVRETRGDEKMAACGQLGGGEKGVIPPRAKRRKEEPAPSGTSS
ncbi:MAG: radical SAM protein, partial [Myxococcales bacterium]|nr:radical SAM protein [Myxococcales bacterium]